MKEEIKYKIHVEPAMFTILEKLRSDIGQFGIEPDEFVRAMWTYADQQLDGYSKAPQWLWQELENKRNRAEASMTVEGEVGVDA